MFGEHIDSERQNGCAKRRSVNGEGSTEGNDTFVKRLKVVVLNRKWDTNETRPSVIGDMQSDTFSEFRVPCSESNGSRNSRTDGYSTIGQCSEINGSVDFPKTIPVETCSDGEYNHIHNDENNYNGSFSWLINFKVGSLFNLDESQQHDKFGEMEETNCPGVY
jgi:hypothetical protein